MFFKIVIDNSDKGDRDILKPKIGYAVGHNEGYVGSLQMYKNYGYCTKDSADKNYNFPSQYCFSSNNGLIGKNDAIVQL